MTLKRKIQTYLLLLVAPLAIALYSQYVDEYHPCELCILQRWAYAIAIFFAILHVGNLRTQLIKGDWFIKLSLLAVFAGFVIAVYHAGIEQKWWEGFQTCSSNMFDSKMTIEQMQQMINSAPVVRCDAITWELFGLSMAAWNAIYALFVTFVGTIFIWRQKFI